MEAKRLATPPHTGGCLCGEVRFEDYGELRPIIACHCNQCRRTTGHFMAATASRADKLKLTHETGLKWFRSSATGTRGFCASCGSSRFWQGPDDSYVAICAGALDDAAGLRIEEHIFVADKAPYYDSTDGLPQHPQSGHNVPPPRD